MYSANHHVIRLAGDADESLLRLFATLSGAPPLEHPILVAEVDGAVVAALSLEDRRSLGDPFTPTTHLIVQLHLRASAFDAHARQPSLRERFSAAVPVRRRSRAAEA